MPACLPFSISDPACRLRNTQLGLSEVSAGNKAAVGHQLTYLGDGRALAWQDQLRRLDGIRSQQHAYFPRLAEQGVQGDPEGGLVVQIDRLLQIGVYPVELVDSGILDLELT